jgi:MiaB/RimO family radical SAM methylthiotransferase
MMKRSYRLESLGCAANHADGGRIAAFLESNGYRVTETAAEAGLIVLMTCGFDQLQEDRNIEHLEQLQRTKHPDALLVVGGCLPAINKARVEAAFDGPLFTPRTLSRLNQIVGPGQMGIERFSGTFWDEERSMQVLRIATGCMHQCAFCAIPRANGRTTSIPREQVLEQMRALHLSGTRSFRLVAEDVAAYGMDRGETILDLLQSIVEMSLPIKVYLDYMHLQWVYQYRQSLLELLENEVFVKHFYWPIQSGSDAVLHRMRRGYTIGQVRELFGQMFSRFPQARLSSDFIVGFPGETAEDFAATRSLLTDYKFWYCNVFKYEERPFTDAVALGDKIPEQEKEERLQLLVGDSLRSLFGAHKVGSLEDVKKISQRSGRLVNINSRLL